MADGSAAVAPRGSPGDVRTSVFSLPQRFLPHEAARLDATWNLSITGHGHYTVRVRGGRCRVAAGAHPRPDATVLTGAETWLEIVAGRQDGVGAFAAGRLHATGDLNLAVQLETLFRPGPRTRRPLRTVRTDTGGFEVESLVAGHGAPVVLVHGLAASKVSFLPTVDGLADRYEVHAIDLPGFGKSAKPLPGGSRYSPRWMADAVAGYLRNRGVDSAYVVGNSMGGRVAVELALRHRRRVRGVVALGSAVAFDEWQWLRPALRLLRSEWLGVAPFPLRRRWVESAIGDLFHDAATLSAPARRAATEEFLRCVRDPRHRLAILAALRHLLTEQANGRGSFWERLRGLAVPSYWVWGDGDRLCPSRYSRRVRDCLPHARVEVWPGIGHVPQFEAPQRTNAAVGAFVDELEATG